MLTAIQTAGEAAGRIRAVKTATATRNWQKVMKCCDFVGKTATRATVWLDADGG